MAPVELGSLLSFPSSARAASISHTEKKNTILRLLTPETTMEGNVLPRDY